MPMPGSAPIDWIKGIVAEPEIGVIYTGKVVKTVDFGAFVNFLGSATGWCTSPNWRPGGVEKVTDVVKMGDRVKVKVHRLRRPRQGEAVDEAGRPGDRRRPDPKTVLLIQRPPAPTHPREDGPIPDRGRTAPGRSAIKR